MKYLPLLLACSVLQAHEIDFSLVTQDSRNWDKISDDSCTLSSPFLLGVSTATWQDSGAANCPDSQWSYWENLVVPESNRSNKSANLFSLYKTQEGRQEIINRLKNLHVNSYRFSIEWSQIEPQEGLLIQESLDPYIALCKDLKDAGIEPMVTLLHFSEPLWFHEKGSFEEEKNIPLFLRFARFVFAQITQPYHEAPLVTYICTINEPAIDAFSRYIFGSFSPGKKLNFAKAGQFLYNALQAHEEIYKECKPLSPATQIGIVHQRLCFIPTNLLLTPVTHYLTQFLNEAPLHFLNTGDFEIYVPLLCHIKKTGPKPHTDFIGLQYYSRPLIGFSGSTSYYEPMTQMPFREDPEGLYEAILDTYAKCPHPLIITENGISTHDEEQRSRYLKRALYAVSRAQEKISKENLQGYYLWSFCKNAEWDMGMHPQNFGAYALGADGHLAQKPYPGLTPFIEVGKKLQVNACGTTGL